MIKNYIPYWLYLSKHLVKEPKQMSASESQEMDVGETLTESQTDFHT